MIMASSTNKPFLFFLIYSIIRCMVCMNEAMIAGGVTVDLIHPDSPISPLYNASETQFDRARKSLALSLARYSHLEAMLSMDMSTKAFGAPVSQSGGGYLMRVGIGTPPFNVWAVADTGSDVAWTQCEPCKQCYQQDAPLFDPVKSSTYRNLPCSSRQCRALESEAGPCNSDGCAYRASYGDRSFSRGSLATETFTFESSTSRNTSQFPNVAFGCGFNNDGTFDSKTSGIIGLGGGALSIVQQLGDAVKGKFSYCLTAPGENATSKISFGSDAVVSGPSSQSTSIVTKSPDTFYFLTLERFEVGETRLEFQSVNPLQTSGEEGNIIIDSGTTLTLLPREFYTKVISSLASLINGRRTQGPQGFDLCYEGSLPADLPPVIAHFKGAMLLLPPATLFVELQQGVHCATFASSGSLGMAIFGNLHQVNYRVGYDLEAKTVSFEHTVCSKS